MNRPGPEPTLGLVVVKEQDIELCDCVDNDVSTERHGFVPKLPGDPTKVLNGVGEFVSIQDLLNAVQDI